MQANDKKRFATLLAGVAEYYGKELSPGVISLYWMGLQQYDIEAVEKALWDHTQSPDNGQFMPKIADITRAMQGRTQDQAAIAWSKVDQAVRRVGTYADVAFDDPIIHRVIADMGGWIWFGNQIEDEWPFVAKNFENRYRGYRVRGEAPDYAPVLIGMANAHNQKEGYRSQPPILIGNQNHAKAVMSGGTTAPLLEMKPASPAPALALIARQA
jgi:hypothetical protein